MPLAQEGMTGALPPSFRRFDPSSVRAGKDIPAAKYGAGFHLRTVRQRTLKDPLHKHLQLPL